MSGRLEVKLDGSVSPVATMSGRLEVKSDGTVCSCTVEDEAVVLLPVIVEPCPDDKGSSVDAADHSLTLAFEDIIAIKKEDTTFTGSSESVGDHPDLSPALSTIIHYIKKVLDDPKWSHATVKITPSSAKERDYETLLQKIHPKFDKVVETRPKKLLVLLNPIGGKRQAQTMYDTVMTPLFELASISCHLIERPKHLIEVVKNYDYKSMDGIVMMGGDGTFTEIVNVLMRKTQEEAGIDYNDTTADLQTVSTPLAIIPTGTGNGVAEGLYGCLDVLTATLHIIRGKIRTSRLLGTYADGKLLGYSGCTCGLGLGADMMYVADTKLRWMKTARYLALPFVFLFRGIRLVEAEFTLNTRKRIMVGDGAEQHEEFGEEKWNQETSMILMWPFPLMDEDGHFNLYKSCIASRNRAHSGDMFVVIYERMGWIQMFKHFRDLIARNDTSSHRKLSLVIKPFPLMDEDGHFNLYKSCIASRNRAHSGDMFVVIYERMGWIQMFKHFRDLIARNDTSSHRKLSLVIKPFPLMDEDGHFNLYKSCIASRNRAHSGDMFVVIYERMGWIQMFKHFRDLIARNDTSFERNFIKVRRAQSVKIKLKEKPGEASIYNRIVAIDGELQECEEPEYFIRMWERPLNVFSSNDLV